MERRKLLLGSGTALATVLAGCSSSETSDDDGDDTDDTEDITENGDENGTENGTESESDDVATDDVPGFDGTKLDLGSDKVTVKKVSKNGDTVDVVVESEVTDVNELYAELDPLADSIETAIDDVEAFADEIETLEWFVDHEGKNVVSLYIDVEWIVGYVDGDLSADEFTENVKQSAE